MGLSARRSEDPEVWKPIIDRVMFQVAYRQLGMVALYCPIDVAAQAIDMLCKEGKGSWKWLLEGRVLVWDNVPIDSALTIHLYVLGGKARRKNTVFIRQGFWRMYVVESALSVFNRSVAGKLLSRI
jgi:hypothetical protein